MASFRKRFQSNATQKSRVYSKGNRVWAPVGVCGDTTAKNISKQDERGVALFKPKDYTSFWGTQGDKFKYLQILQSIIQVDLEMRKSKHNAEVI